MSTLTHRQEQLVKNLAKDQALKLIQSKCAEIAGLTHLLYQMEGTTLQDIENAVAPMRKELKVFQAAANRVAPKED